MKNTGITVVVFLLALSLVLFCINRAREDAGTDLASNSSTTEETGGNLSEAELVSVVAENLGVPNENNFTYEIGDEFYLETAGLYCRNVDFYEKGELVASATVASSDGELVRNILRYENVE